MNFSTLSPWQEMIESGVIYEDVTLCEVATRITIGDMGAIMAGSYQVLDSGVYQTSWFSQRRAGTKMVCRTPGSRLWASYHPKFTTLRKP